MDFTVIIPSRNRPLLVRKAIESVLMQTHHGVEVLVVNDGSDGAHEQAYIALEMEFANKVRFLNLEKSRKGHGSSGAINRGADVAQGTFLCFLDDDDYWTDKSHLERAFHSLNASGAELYFANQEILKGSTPVAELLWLGPLKETISRDATEDAYGSYPVTAKDLMKCPGFGHFNTTICSKTLFSRIQGLDENIRYENDLDFYLRVIDAATSIRYFPGIVSLHNVPDPTKVSNMSTALSTLDKLLFRLYAWDKALLFSQAVEIRRSATVHKSSTLKKISLSLADKGSYMQSFHYAKQALAAHFSFKWMLYCGYLLLRMFFRACLSNSNRSGTNP